MSYKTVKCLTALFSLFLSACVSQPPDTPDFDKQQAAKARIELGLGYLAQHNNELAKLNFDKALSYTPDYYLVHSALAYFYQQMGDVAQAEKSYIKAINLDGKQGDVYNNYGTFLCTQGKFEQAYKQFSVALNSPDYYRQADTYENMVLCALSANDTVHYDESMALLEKVAPERAWKLKSVKK
ncbi:MAG TPA: type IV pilus biogenesis/stability protein PilW [Pasteurellaceae bacterium]|nr:type IV pilus biogenesis/stability protein PilW [Pasteurellaceae bacterium]